MQIPILECTVVSMHPRAISEQKPTVNTYINVPAAPRGDFVVFPVSWSEYSRYVLDGVSIAVPIKAEELAQSIVFDYCSNQLCYDADAGPGIFWVKGNLTKAEVSLKHKAELEAAATRQRRWCAKLVNMADVDWSKRPSPNSISDLQRWAADELGVDRPWMHAAEMLNAIVVCPACATKVPAAAAVCSACQCVVNEEAYKKLKFAKAG